ncbi:hypothetical protein AK812_SmicGene21421 [Symbiodinium microadriaticum]|uniref:Uncharacterized protein n=1 Tax=Symbiodinium microadriaticum TaxID=2951 RepID=A0A1Q9DMG7_SYMMI|nr:hypothetical protein AK812_SmicGene21421 [Symbiodinium microadriaticum]
MRSWLGLGSAEASGGYASGSAPAAEEVVVPPEVDESLLKPRLRTTLHLTGKFANWETTFAASKLQQVPAVEGQSQERVRLKLCVKLNSQSLSFQVVNPEKDWSWRLYPRDAQPLRFTHVSKEGKLVANDPDAVVVAIGDLKAGHGLNFHVVEEPGSIVTVWVEVPIVPVPGEDAVDLDFEGPGARVWYTVEVDDLVDGFMTEQLETVQSYLGV